MSFGGRTVKYFVCTCFHAGIDIKQGDIINKPENEARKRQKEGRKKKRRKQLTVSSRCVDIYGDFFFLGLLEEFEEEEKNSILSSSGIRIIDYIGL